MATRQAPAGGTVVHLPLRAPRVPSVAVPSEPKAPPVAPPRRNPWEEAARERKTAHLVLAADDLARHSGVTLSVLIASMESWGDGDWTKLALAAGQKPPSSETRALVLGRLRARAARQAPPPAAVTRYFVVRKPDARYAWKHDIGAAEGYATEGEAEKVAAAELARGRTSGSGFAEEIWVEPRQVRT
jgi:hypothetical protein